MTISSETAVQDESPNNYRSCPSHCCKQHGCKYGYEGCPVENGTVKQDHSCEQCDFEQQTMADGSDYTYFIHEWDDTHYETLDAAVAARDAYIAYSSQTSNTSKISQHWVKELPN